MCERIGSPDLEYVATAVRVQSQTGGSLAGLFDTLSETVRERQRHARKVKALTALGRMSAIVLVRCRSGSAALMTLLSPAYMAPLYTTSGGHTLIVVCLPFDGDRLPAHEANRLGEVLAMIILLVAGLGCLALLGFQLVRPRRDRRPPAPRGTRSGPLLGGRRHGRRPGARTEVRASCTRLRPVGANPPEALAKAVAARHLRAASPRRHVSPPDRRALHGGPGRPDDRRRARGLHARGRRTADRARDRLRPRPPATCPASSSVGLPPAGRQDRRGAAALRRPARDRNRGRDELRRRGQLPG